MVLQTTDNNYLEKNKTRKTKFVRHESAGVPLRTSPYKKPKTKITTKNYQNFYDDEEEEEEIN